jgi:hypothetical protein
MNNFWIRSVFHDGGACIVDCPTCRDLGAGAWGRGLGVARGKGRSEGARGEGSGTCKRLRLASIHMYGGWVAPIDAW